MAEKRVIRMINIVTDDQSHLQRENGNVLQMLFHAEMVMCWAPNCQHYSESHTCKFFKFPTVPRLRNKWTRLVRRKKEAGPYARLCSCHFVDGKKENLPTLFDHNVNKHMSFSSPEKKKRRIAPSTVISESVIPSSELAERVSPEHIHESAEDLPGPSSSMQGTDFAMPSTSVVQLETEIYFLRKSLEEAESISDALSFKKIETNNAVIKSFTGLPTASVFLRLYKLLENQPVNYYFGWKVEKVPKIDQLLMCLMKLRQNYTHVDLAHRFNVSQGTVSNIIISWIRLLHAVLFKQLMCRIPPRKKNQTCLPTAFNNFTNCRIVLDCTEMAMTVPRNSMSTQKSTYSSYKHSNTWKALIGVAPNGVVTFVSTLYPGGMSDKKIVKNSGILDQLESGDLILADKGFLIGDLLPSGVSLNIPPFLSTAQFTPMQVKLTESIARARIHVERAIRRIKLYRILRLIPRSLFEHAGEILQVIGALTNLQNPLIDEVKSDYSAD